MGLDMYLTSKLYIGANYEHNKIAGKIELTKDGQPINVDLSRLSRMVFEEAYWRKANAIHKWFVDNVQNGVDECQESYVTKKQLIELRAVCQQILNRAKLVKGRVQNGYTFKDGETIPILEEGGIAGRHVSGRGTSTDNQWLFLRRHPVQPMVHPGSERYR